VLFCGEVKGLDGFCKKKLDFRKGENKELPNEYFLEVKTKLIVNWKFEIQKSSRKFLPRSEYR